MWEAIEIATERGPFPALAAGDGEPLLCLHGFPDGPETFAPLAERLVGRRVVAPFLRGYHPSTAATDYFDGGTLAADTAALCEAVAGGDPADVVGHDWGALAVYGVTAAFPERVARAVAMAVPPPLTIARLGFDPAQLRRSFYIWFFQLEGLPEHVLTSSSDFVDELWRTWSPELAEPPHLSLVRERLADPAIARCALGYYRAMFDDRWADPKLSDVRHRVAGMPQRPILVIGGRADGCLDGRFMEQAATDLAAGSRIEVLDGAGHFMHLDRPETVAQLVADWLTP